MRRIKVLILLPVLLALGACLPASAPTISQVEKFRDPEWLYYLVPVSKPVINVLEQYPGLSFPASFHTKPYNPSIALRPGDVINISIFETGGPSLFSSPVQANPALAAQPDQTSSASRTTTLPNQIVETNGKVLIPFGGAVAVAGKTPAEAARAIEHSLASQVINPQVIVSLVSGGANTASVGGEANKPGLVQLSLRGERLLDVVAMAGGSRFPAVDTDVRVQRGGQISVVPLQRIISHPEDNIFVRPRDAIVLVRNPKTFSVMGAAQKVSQFSFDTERVSVAEAVARAGGPVDTVGALSGVYVFRYEPADKAQRILAADPKAIDPDAPSPPGSGRVPIIYKMNLAEPEGYFAAQTMPIQDKDVVLVTNAEGTQLLKAFALARGVTGMVFDLRRGVTP